jgi:uncharacterized protein (TIRG00374 family)
MDWNALGATLLDVKILPAGFCALMIAIGIALRGWRWSLIACERQSWRKTAVFIRATNLGVLGNQLLPSRLGDAARVFALARLLPTGLSESFGSAVIDRVCDVAVLLFSGWLVSTLAVSKAFPRTWLISLGALLAALLIMLAIVCTKRFHAWFEKWAARWLRRWALHLNSFLSVFRVMSRRLLQLNVAVSVFGVMALIWLADYLTVAAAIWSIGLDLPMAAPMMLWVMLAIGSTLPSTPGYVGVYQLAAVLALAVYGVPAHQAVAISFVLQIITLSVPLLTAGRELKML